MSHYDIITAQPRAWRILARTFTLGRVGQAYLFCGADGLGHWPLAVRFAALLNCENVLRDNDDHLVSYPCGECGSCRTITSINSPYLLPVVPVRTAKSAGDPLDLTNEILQARRSEPFCTPVSKERVSISIEAVRNVKIFLSRKCEPGRRRVVLFDQIEKTLPVATDALLKTLEEPPEDTTIILTTDAPDGITPTILSRCRKLRLSSSSLSALSDYLKRRFSLTDEHARRMAHISEGNIGKAVSMVSEARELHQDTRIRGFGLFKSLFDSTSADTAAGLIEALPRKDYSLGEEMLTLWQSFVRDCAWYGAAGDEEGIVNSDFLDDICRLGAFFDGTRLAPAMLTAMKNTLADLRRNAHIHIAFTALSLELGALTRATR